MADPRNARIALAHDWLVGMRGGEWVLDRLAQLFGPTDLYTLVNDGRHLSDAIAACNIITSPLQNLPGASGTWRRHYLPLYRWAVERLHIQPGSCDVLISTSSAVMKSIKPPSPPRSVPHICYCHSPARYIWEQTDDYSGGAGGRVRALGLRMIRNRFQRWDRRTADRVTHFLANSAHTAARIKRCFDRDAQVVYPPVRTSFFTPDSAVHRDNWFLIVAALEPYKRTDLAIDAANQHGFALRIAGDGSQRGSLMRMAGTNVQFLGRVSDEQLRDLYRRARALIFPQIEDFGMIAVEAQACGCPVIAFEEGGARETVTPQTGVMFNAQTVESLRAAMNAFNQGTIDPHTCVESASRFSEANFDRAILACVNSVLASLRGPEASRRTSPIPSP